ncbi:MAG: hypothetical protein VYB34_01540 [Planctomycetota bacterium]|nr:hypothetical protein [Planctomycetota bacterium]
MRTVMTFASGLFLVALFGCARAPEILNPDGRAYAILHLTFDS